MSIYDTINNKVNSGINSLYGNNPVNTSGSPVLGVPMVYAQPNGGMSTPTYGMSVGKPNIPSTPVTPVTPPTTSGTKKQNNSGYTQIPSVSPDYKSTTGTTPPATPGSVASLPGAPVNEGYNYIGQDGQVYNSLTGLVNTPGNSPIDENAVYQNTLSQYQSQIDAINNIYNDQLIQSRVQNAPTYQRRLGATGVLAVNQGLTGSNVGNSMQVQTEQANAQEQAAAEAIINDRREQSLAAIRGEIRKSSQEALQRKYDAQKQGSDAVLSELNARPEKKKAALATGIKAFISSGGDISKLSEEEIKSIAKDYGLSVEDVKAEYSSQQGLISDAKLKSDKTKAELEKLQKETAQIGKLTPYQAAQLAKEGNQQPKTYKIKQGDTLYNIAQSLGLNPDSLVAANPSVNALNMRAGQVINLPTSSKAPNAVETYNSATIPSDIKSTLMVDVQDKNVTLAELAQAYPQVDTKYLSDLLASVNQ